MNLKTPIIIPLKPFPTITAPMYFGGSIPAYPYTLACPIPAKTPKKSKIEKLVQKPASGDIYLAIRGKTITTKVATIK